MDLDTLIEKMIDRQLFDAKITQPRPAIIAEAIDTFTARIVLEDASMRFTRAEIPGGVDLVLAPDPDGFANAARQALRGVRGRLNDLDIDRMRRLWPETRLRVISNPFNVQVIAGPVPIVMLDWYMEIVRSFVGMADGLKRWTLAMELRAQSAH